MANSELGRKRRVLIFAWGAAAVSFIFKSRLHVGVFGLSGRVCV